MANIWDELEKQAFEPNKKEQPAAGGSVWDTLEARAFGNEPQKSVTSNRFSAAIDQYQAGLLGAGEAVTGALGITGAEEALRERRIQNEQAAERSLSQAREQGAVESYKDVKDLSSAGSYIAGLAIQSAPYAAEAIVGGLGARALMGGTRAALAASAGDVAAEALARQSLARGSQVGAAAASYPSAVGDVLQNQREQSGKTDLASAAGLAVPYAALNVLGVEGTLAKGELFRSAGSLLDDVSGVKGGLLRAGVTGVKTGAGESVSETAQEGLNQLGRMAVDPNEKFITPESVERFKESAVGGFVLGGAAGSIGGGWRRSEGSILPGSTDSGNLDVSNKPDNNAINKAIDANSTEIDINTNQQVTEIQQQQAELQRAQQEAKIQADEVAAQQAQAQAQAAEEQAKQLFTETAQVYGVKPLDVANQFEVAGKRFFSIPQATAFLQEIDKLNEGKPLEQKALLGAALSSGAVKVSQTANPKAINNAAIKFLDSWGFGDSQSKAEAAERAEILISSLEGPKALQEADQLNSFYKSITGTDSPAFVSLQQLAAETTPKKGASNERLQLQDNAGLRAVPVQGRATQTSGTEFGGIRPSGVQPVQPGSVGTGSPSIQAGAVPSSGVPTSTSADGTRANLAVNSNAQEAQVISDERVDAINAVEQIAKRAFGDRDYQIIMEFIQSDATMNQSQVAEKFGISRQRVNQIVGAAKEGESFNDTIERRAQESWGPRFLLAGRNMGYSKDEVRGLFEVIQKSQDETSLAAVQQAQALSEGATEEELQGKEKTESELESEETRTLGMEETSDTEKGAAGYRVFTPGVSGETGIEGASSVNRAKFSKKALKDMSDEQLQNIAADEETTEERLDDVINEMLRRQEIRVNKGKENAIQKPSTEKKAVRNKPAASEGIREQDTEERKAAREGQTDEEAAAEAWNEGVKDFPEAPKFADLTEEQQDDWISFGPDNWTKDDVQTELIKLAKQPKYSTNKKKVDNTWNTNELTKNLKATFASDESFKELVTIVDTVEELFTVAPELLETNLDKVDPELVRGFATEGGKVYLVANNIEKGEELAVLLHELGAHIGMQNLIGEYNYKKIVAQLERWVKGNGTPIEVKIAKEAQSRIDAAKEEYAMTKEQEKHELLAYFVEEALLAGINPTATNIKGAGQIIQFLRSLVANMKVALRKIGFNKFEKLTAKNIVDLAFGAAKLELDSVYHGTEREFRSFNDTYITNFMSGWGHYTSNLPAESGAYGAKTIRALPLVDRQDLIQNDRPMGDQPRIMKMLDRVINQSTAQAKALKDFLATESVENIDGSDFQQLLGKFEVESDGGLFKLLNKDNQASVVEVEEIVSKFLEQAGILGSTFKPYGRGMPNRQTIMFSGKNLSRISQETDRGLKFSIKKAREEASKQINKLPPNVAKPTNYVVDTIEHFAKKSLPYFAFTEDLADMAAKFIPSVKKYVNLMKERQATRTRLERQVDDILQDYDKLPSGVKGTGENSVNKFLMDSTRDGKWAYNPGWIKGFKEETDIDPDMKARFDALPAAAQKLVQRVFAHGQSTLLTMQKAVIENINSEYDALIAAAKKAGNVTEEQDLVKKKAASLSDYRTLMRLNSKKPYAPLKRFGDYVVVGKSQQYLDNEKIVNDKTSSPDVKAEAAKKLRELEKNDMHYFVQFAETVGEAKAIARTEAGNYAQVEDFEKDTSNTYGGRDIQSTFHRLRNLVEDTKDSNLGDASERAVNRLLADLHLTLLSEQSARQSERRRRGIGGAEKDMMRAFATQGRATASFISSLENTGSIYDILREMKEETDKGTVGTRGERRQYYNEFMKRHFMGMDYRPSPFMDKALSTTSMWMLLTNPSYYLQNMTQPFMMSLPVIGGRYGYARTWKEMTRAYTDIASVIKKHGLSEDSYNKLPEDVRNVVEVLVNRGRIDISLEQDLGRWRSTEDSKLAKFGRASELLRGMAQDIETINRVATAVAAYRLALKGPKGNPTMATNYADNIIYTTHGDYSGFNAPRITRQGLGRLATQFRKFQLIQISLIARLYNDAFRSEDADTRAIGKRALAYTLGHTAVMGGIMGLPGFAAIAALYGMLFGDEDEPDNPELALRRAIGDDSLADLLVKGVPAALGVDVSGKLGMGQMLSILPYTDVKFTRKDLPAAGYALLTGPFGGLTLKAADGMNYIGSGDYHKGLEQLLPSGLGNLLKAERYATEGITTRAGDVVMKPEDIGAVDAFMVALGLPTKPLTDRNFLNAAKFQYDEFYNEKASEIKREYVRAYKEGDNAGLQEARDEWKTLQESRAKNGYSKQPLSNLLKAPQEQKKRERNVTGGVQFNKSNRGFVKQTSEL